MSRSLQSLPPRHTQLHRPGGREVWVDCSVDFRGRDCCVTVETVQDSKLYFCTDFFNVKRLKDGYVVRGFEIETGQIRFFGDRHETFTVPENLIHYHNT